MVVAIRTTRKKDKNAAAAIHRLSERTPLSDVTEWIPSGFPDLDRILGGGWAVGRVSEISGPEGSGKSALAHMAILQAQLMGGAPMIQDYEVALDEDKISNLGIDSDLLLYDTPEHVEMGWAALNASMHHLRSHPPFAPHLMVWDSVAMAPTKKHLEGEEGAFGEKARINTGGFTKSLQAMARVRGHLMLINQNRVKMGGGMFDTTRTPGGEALRFAASIRVSTWCMKKIFPRVEKGIPPSGYVIRVKTLKCRGAPPHQWTEFVLDFQDGPSPDLTMRHVLMQTKRIKSCGGGRYKGTWSDLKFQKKDWRECLEDSDFRRGANEAYGWVVAMGGLQGYNVAARSESDEEDDSED